MTVRQVADLWGFLIVGLVSVPVRKIPGAVQGVVENSLEDARKPADGRYKKKSGISCPWLMRKDDAAVKTSPADGWSWAAEWVCSEHTYNSNAIRAILWPCVNRFGPAWIDYWLKAFKKIIWRGNRSSKKLCMFKACWGENQPCRNRW